MNTTTTVPAAPSGSTTTTASTVNDRIRGLASAQHGAFSRAQAREAGLSAKLLRSRVSTGALVAVTPRVFVVSGSPATPLQRAVCAVLDSGARAALSHVSAAAFWNLSGFELEPLHVTLERDGHFRPSTLSVLHTTTCLPPTHVTCVDGLHVTVPARVLFDLAGTVHPARLPKLIDAAWRQGYVTGRLLRRTLAELAEHGRDGIQIMRLLLEDRGDDYRPPESNLESRFEELMGEIGMRSLTRQVDSGGIDWIGRVDFLDRALRLVIEIDSDTFHLSITDRAHDAARRAALEEAGFTVLVIRAHDVWHRPEHVKEQVRQTRRRLLAQGTAPQSR